MRPAALLIFTILCTTPVAGQDRSGVEKEIWTKEQAIAKAVTVRDVKTVRSLISPDQLIVDSTGIVTVPMFEKGMSDCVSSMPIMSNPTFKWSDNSNVFLVYAIDVKSTCGKDRYDVKGAASSLWSNKNGTWTSVFHQESYPPTPVR